MKRTVIVLGLVAACVVADIEMSRQRALQRVITRNAETVSIKTPPVANAPQKQAANTPASATSPEKIETNTNKSAQRDNGPDPNFTYNGYQVEDPMARVALNFVGADPEAEQYWLNAVNDPSLSGEERKDLIEDLNETGLADAQHPTPADMTVIVQRLALVEQLQSWPIMDDVNRDALIEVEKDLVTLLQGGTPQ